MPRIKVPVAPNPAVDHSIPEIAKPTSAHKLKRFTSIQLVVVGFGLVLVVLIVVIVSLFSDRNKLQTQLSKLSNPAAASTNQVQQLVSKVSKLYDLPTGETPTLATVADASKVNNQAFFKNAQNGDKVLLYSHAGLAVLYRPSTNKIISVAPVNLNGSSASSSGPTQ